MSKESTNIVKADSNFNEEREENRSLVQQVIDNLDVPMDKMLDKVRTQKTKCVQQSQEDPGRPAVGAQDSVDLCKETQLLLHWSSETSPINPVQERRDAENEDPESFGKDLGDDDSAQRVKYGQWSVSELKKSPESSQFRLKWPPEGSTLKPIPEKSEDAGNGEEDKQKRMFSKRRKRTMMEIHKDPAFAWFLPKWPPEGSSLVRSGGQSFTDSHEK